MNKLETQVKSLSSAKKLAESKFSKEGEIINRLNYSYKLEDLADPQFNKMLDNSNLKDTHKEQLKLINSQLLKLKTKFSIS